MNNYYKKYLKYKMKYLELKNINLIQIGGKPKINNIRMINLFSNQKQEKFLNPIYGLILYECGFVQNNYFIDVGNGIHQIIRNICRAIPGTVLPTNKIEKLEPIDFGRFIALKYLNSEKLFISITEQIQKKGSSKKADINFTLLNNYKDNKDYKEISNDKTILSSYIFKLNKYIPVDSHHENIYFWLLLYCFWWVAKNDDCILAYYRGINEVFTIINKYLHTEHKTIDIEKESNNYNFENDIFEITYKPLTIFDQEKSANFCLNGKQTYSDCGEITAMNLINLLLWDNTKFDVELLINAGIQPIDQLIEFYTVFDNFDKQSSLEKQSIYGLKLNARDAWSYLIIFYAHYNLNFSKKCDNHTYDLDSGLNKDKSRGNFFQLIQNLLKIKSWNNLQIHNINSIEDNTDDGIGYISIEHVIYNVITINCIKDHYFMEIEDNHNIERQVKNYEIEKQNLIAYFLYPYSKINDQEYLWIKYKPQLLIKLINSNKTPRDIRINLFRLCISIIYDSSVRKEINITVDSNFYRSILSSLIDYEYIDDFTFLAKNFTFITTFPKLKSLNCFITDKDIKNENLDLSLLINIESIGDNFLSNCANLNTINLSPLSNVKSIGDNFLSNCANLNTINLSPLCQIIIIGDSFLYNCKKLLTIDLSPLSNVKLIGDSFLSKCTDLNTIILTPLTNITSIGDNFLYKCTKLTTINLTPLTNITSIGNNFLSYCANLENINLTPLTNIISIGESFLMSCARITTLDLSSLSKIKFIDNNFLSRCTKLTTLNLSLLINIKSIGDNFLLGCTELSNLDLGHLQLGKIGNNFMSNCSKIQTIDLKPLRNISIISDDFMSNCSNLQIIHLNNLFHISSIGNNFLYNCLKLEEINLISFYNVTSIGNNFLADCTSLNKINLSPLNKVKIFNYNFMSNCTNITEITLLSLEFLEIIDDNVFSNCKKLKSINLSSLKNLQMIGNNFLYNCEELELIDLSQLTNLKTIGDDFLAHCTKLKSIDLSQLTSLESVGNNFLLNCSQLFTLTKKTGGFKIGSNYLVGCTRLNSLF